MILDCVNSFGDHSSWPNRRTIDLNVATVRPLDKRLGWICKIGSNWEIAKIKTLIIISLNLVSKLKYLSLLQVRISFKFETQSMVWGSSHSQKNTSKSSIWRRKRVMPYLGQELIPRRSQSAMDHHMHSHVYGGLILVVAAIFNNPPTSRIHTYSMGNNRWYLFIIFTTSTDLSWSLPCKT